MDWDGLGVIGAITLVVLAVLAIILLAPLMGMLMEYIITDWFGKEIDTTLYWTGVGLITVFGTLYQTSNKKEKD